MNAISSVEQKDVSCDVIIDTEGTHKTNPKLHKKLMNKLKKLYKFNSEYKPSSTFLLLWNNNTIDFDVNHLAGSCMANQGLRPLSIETTLKYFDRVIVQRDEKLIYKLYRYEHQKFMDEYKDDPDFIPPGLYTDKELKRIKARISRNKKEKS